MMEDHPIDLAQCELEPIHWVNSIQPVGSFIRLRYFDLKVIGCSQDLLTDGRIPLLKELFDMKPELSDWLRSVDSQGIARISTEFKVKSGVSAAYAYRTDEEIHVELEDIKQTVAAAHVGDVSNQIHHASSIEQLLETCVEVISDFTGFERVMLYRFDEEYHGHVVAEKILPESKLVSYLGHHFPKSDIPSQARAMLEQKFTRYIWDVDAKPVPIVSEKGAGIPDLSLSEYRYPSLIHLEYLTNMRVKSTYTISLIYKGKLWGLIACHHSSLHHLHPLQRNICVRISHLINEKLSLFIDKQVSVLATKLRPFKEALHRGELLQSKDQSQAKELKSLFKADHFCYLKNGEVINHDLKNADNKAELFKWIDLQTDKGVFATNSLFYYLTEDYLPEVAGALIIPLGKGQHLALIRSVYPEIMTWAGNPDKAVAGKDANGRISPRKSFESWVEDQQRFSSSWEPYMIEAVKLFNVG